MPYTTADTGAAITVKTTMVSLTESCCEEEEPLRTWTGTNRPISTPIRVMKDQMMKTPKNGRFQIGPPLKKGSTCLAISSRLPSWNSSISMFSDDMDVPRHESVCAHHCSESSDAVPARELAVPRVETLVA